MASSVYLEVLASIPMLGLRPSARSASISVQRTIGFRTTPGPMRSLAPDMTPLGVRWSL